jgi:undecaprenyl-diphosphatase
VGGLLLTQLLKAAIRRSRPELDEPFVQLATYSFPSGHALAATATYGALAIVLAASMQTRRGRVLLAGALGALVFLVATSRVVLGFHYLLDVTSGVVGGIALLSALLLVFEGVSAGDGRLWREQQPQRPRIDP